MKHTQQWHTLNRGQSIDYVRGDIVVMHWRDNGAHFVRIRDRHDVCGAGRIYPTTIAVPTYRAAAAAFRRACRLADAVATSRA